MSRRIVEDVPRLQRDQLTNLILVVHNTQCAANEDGPVHTKGAYAAFECGWYMWETFRNLDCFCCAPDPVTIAVAYYTLVYPHLVHTAFAQHKREISELKSLRGKAVYVDDVINHAYKDLKKGYRATPFIHICPHLRNKGSGGSLSYAKLAAKLDTIDPNIKYHISTQWDMQVDRVKGHINSFIEWFAEYRGALQYPVQNVAVLTSPAMAIEFLEGFKSVQRAPDELLKPLEELGDGGIACVDAQYTTVEGYGRDYTGGLKLIYRSNLAKEWDNKLENRRCTSEFVDHTALLMMLVKFVCRYNIAHATAARSVTGHRDPTLK